VHPGVVVVAGVVAPARRGAGVLPGVLAGVLLLDARVRRRVGAGATRRRGSEGQKARKQGHGHLVHRRLLLNKRADSIRTLRDLRKSLRLSGARLLGSLASCVSVPSCLCWALRIPQAPWGKPWCNIVAQPHRRPGVPPAVSVRGGQRAIDPRACRTAGGGG